MFDNHLERERQEDINLAYSAGQRDYHEHEMFVAAGKQAQQDVRPAARLIREVEDRSRGENEYSTRDLSVRMMEKEVSGYDR